MRVEKWKPYKGFENRYEVSNTGKVRTVKRTGFHPKNRWGKPHTFTVHVRRIKHCIDKYGYPQLGLRDENGIDHRRTIHRMVAEMFVPGWFPGAQVNHKDGNKKNNKASNLEWVTASQNIRHSYAVLGKKTNLPLLIGKEWHQARARARARREAKLRSI